MGFMDAAKLPPEAESGQPGGRVYHAACLAWFKSDGSPRPLEFKFRDDEDVIQTVNNMKVNYVEDKNYSGIPSKEYGCTAMIGGLLREFKLVFYMETGKWVMLI